MTLWIYRVAGWLPRPLEATALALLHAWLTWRIKGGAE